MKKYKMIRISEETYMRVLENERRTEKRFKSWDRRIKALVGEI